MCPDTLLKNDFFDDSDPYEVIFFGLDGRFYLLSLVEMDKSFRWNQVRLAKVVVGRSGPFRAPRRGISGSCERYDARESREEREKWLKKG